jgi:ssDNA-specific exonuclease RecJ
MKKQRLLTKSKYELRRYLARLAKKLDSQKIRVETLPIFEDLQFESENAFLTLAEPKEKKRKGRPKKIVENV